MHQIFSVSNSLFTDRFFLLFSGFWFECDVRSMQRVPHAFKASPMYILRSHKHVLVRVLLFTQLTDENHTNVRMQHSESVHRAFDTKEREEIGCKMRSGKQLHVSFENSDSVFSSGFVAVMCVFRSDFY